MIRNSFSLYLVIDKEAYHFLKLHQCTSYLRVEDKKELQIKHKEETITVLTVAEVGVEVGILLGKKVGVDVGIGVG